jgi:hypothetical protein
MSIRIKDTLPSKKHVESADAFGIEIELEGLPKDIAIPKQQYNNPEPVVGVGIVGDYVIEPHATAHEDGSLRNRGIEFVTRVLSSEKEVNEALDTLQYVAKKLKLKTSNRAGIHVHENVQHLTFHEVWDYLCLYILFEPALFDFIGEGRERSVYSRPLIKHIPRDIFRNMAVYMKADMFPVTEHKYYALNVSSLSRFGTVEYRHMKSTLDFDRLREWLSIIRFLKTQTAKTSGIQTLSADDVISMCPSTWKFVNKYKWRKALESHCLPLLKSIQGAPVTWQRGTGVVPKVAPEEVNVGFQMFMGKVVPKPKPDPSKMFKSKYALADGVAMVEGNTFTVPPNWGVMFGNDLSPAQVVPAAPPPEPTEDSLYEDDLI